MAAQATHLKSQFLHDDRHVAPAARDSLAAELARDVSTDEAADVMAQATACAGPILAAQWKEWESGKSWFLSQAAEWERFVLESLTPEYAVLSTQYPSTAYPTAAPHLYEHFLHAWQRPTRKRRGVFFTPQRIADYIIAEVDRRLREDFEFADGLAERSKGQGPRSKVAILDPACGTGVFLLSAVDRLHRQSGNRWNELVPDVLLQLIGVEILPAAAFLAKLNIALKLADTGYDFRKPGKINIRIGDALDPNLQSAICNLRSAIPIIVGNPPFSSLSTNTNAWIARLVRGDDEIRGYVRANGQSLGERKTWLHDDYVKFIRLAQWHVEQAGCGIVGFVTNHGYLDNATFRLMRQELLRVFPHIQIVDLHGNRKNGEVAPDGRPNENVFGLDQGVAVAILTRSVSERVAPQVKYTGLWGSREDKLAALDTPSLTLRVSVRPEAPNWRFVPSRSQAHPEYDAGWLLTDMMPVNTPAPVTARDHFVVGFTAEELQRRIQAFCDLSIPDDEIRRRYFTRTRSARYQPGDTRGWKLGEARRIIAADSDWQRHIVRCLYRPFDWRYVFWHPAMIDWPRTEVTKHLVANVADGETERRREGERENSSNSLRLSIPPSLRLALIARRQQLPTQPCAFFWVSDGLALDGVIRNDNRGSESLFPLYLFDEPSGAQPRCRANFNPDIIAQFASRLGLVWRPLGRGDLVRTFGPEDLVGYIYALFHSPRYRRRYADQLRTNFPRVLPPADLAHFSRWSMLGRELIDLHLFRAGVNVLIGIPQSASRPESHGGPSLQKAQQFRAGGYVALKKWLQPPHRSAADPQFGQIARAIARTIELMAQLDTDA
jgi:predicted helicase